MVTVSTYIDENLLINLSFGNRSKTQICAHIAVSQVAGKIDSTYITCNENVSDLANSALIYKAQF